MALKVPISFTSEGMMLVVLPPLTAVMDNTEGLKGLLFLLIICCSDTIKCAVINMVSAVYCGAAAWPPLALMEI